MITTCLAILKGKAQLAWAPWVRSEVIVEEAAEVLEPQILAVTLENC